MISPEVHRAEDGTLTYRVRFRHGISEKTKRPKYTSETFTSKRQALEFAKWLAALGSQGALDKLYEGEQQAAVPTLDKVAADHIVHLPGIEDGTRKTYVRLWDRVWSPRIGFLPANQITRDVVARAVNELGTRYSHKSLENQRGLLAAVLERCIDLGYLSKNPARGMRLPRGQEANRAEMQILNYDQFLDVLDLTPEHYRPLLWFLYGTGCRWGEAVALTVADVSLPDVRIRRALKWSPDNQRKVGPPKTPQGNRTITLPVELHDMVRDACAGKSRTDLVFTAPRGGPVLHRTFWSRVWLPAVSHIEPRPRIHDLRHTHASVLLAAGVPINIVSRRLGHSKISVTVDTYGHLLPDAQLMAANAASLAFTQRPALSPAE